jgi:hypothetical protein
VLLHNLQHRPTQLRHGTEGKERRLPVSSTASSCFFRSISLFSSFFSPIGMEAEEWWEIVQKDVGCAGATTPTLKPHSVTTEEEKRLGSASMVKRRNKNDLTRHPTPHMMHHLHHEIRQPYPKRVLQLPWGLPKLRIRRQNSSSRVRAAQSNQSEG